MSEVKAVAKEFGRMGRQLGRLLGMIDALERAQKWEAEDFAVPGWETKDVIAKLIEAKKAWDQEKGK